MQIIFSAGLGSTGSSAVVDLLKEVESIQVVDREFRLFVDPDGLVSLRDAILENWTVFQTDVALRRFRKLVKRLNRRGFGPYSLLNHREVFGNKFLELTEEFLDNITEIQFKGMWYGVDNIIFRILNKIGFTKRSFLTSREMYLGKSLTVKEFDQHVSNYINQLYKSILDNNVSGLCIEENLSGMFADKIFSMCPNSKIVQVVRDPKDVYADSLRVNWHAIPSSFDKYLKWQENVYKTWIKKEKDFFNNEFINKRLLVIRFEDLIQNYESTIKEIFCHLNISENNHIRKKEFLIPESSKKNIGQYKDILSSEEIRMFDEKFDFFNRRYGY